MTEEVKKKFTIADALRKLNKGRDEEDKIKLASNQSSNYFSRTFISTSSPYLDYMIKEEVGEGGFVKGSYNMLVGGEGSAKTSVALLAASQEQKSTGKYVVYLDGESSLNDSYLDRFGIDKSLFIYHKGRNLEEMLDNAEMFSKSDEVGMIIIDSIPIFVSTSVEAKEAGDNHIGIEAKRYTTRMPIIEGNCNRRDICLLGLTFYTFDPGSMGDPRVLKRGVWQKLMSNLTIEFTKKDIIKDKFKKPIGHVIDVRIKKSKLKEYDSKKVFSVNFYYEYGFNEFDEYASIFIECGLVSQASAWFSFPDENGEEVKVQGKHGVAEVLKSRPATFEHLKSKFNSKN